MDNKIEVIILTGMSGSGKSKALDTLEDLGYYCIDNLPPELLPKFCQMATQSKSVDKIAAVMDLRSGEFFESLFSSIEELKNLNISYKIIFLEASQDAIIARYKEGRRPHPLNPSIIEGYKMEKENLGEIRKKSNSIIDTTLFSAKDLKKYLIEVLTNNEETEITIQITSFGYKNNILKDADLVFDVRFLPNPYYIKELQDKDGLSEETRDYVLKWDVSQTFIDKVIDLLKFLIPNYIKEGKSVLNIGFGCTGGFHRSVVIAEEVARILKKDYKSLYVSHRDRKKKLWIKE